MTGLEIDTRERNIRKFNAPSNAGPSATRTEKRVSKRSDGGWTSIHGPGTGNARTPPVYVSTTSLKGVPFGKVSNARCCNSSDGTARGAVASLGGIGFISHPSGSGTHNSVDESVRR